jgi:spermidine synthase
MLPGRPTSRPAPRRTVTLRPTNARAPSSALIRFDKPSPFGRVLVVDEGDLRHMRFGGVNGADQSTISRTDPGAAPMECIRHALVGLALTGEVRRALLIGMGGGSFSTLLLRAFPRASVDAVEINPVVVEAAKRFFGVTPGPRLRVHTVDGAAFVHKAPAGSYDLIFLDAYGEADDPPAGLATSAFYHELRTRLSSGGVLVVNLSVPDATERVLAARINAAFPGCASLAGERDKNLVLFGPADGATLPELATAVRRARALGGFSFDLGALTRRVRAGCR